MSFLVNGPMRPEEELLRAILSSRHLQNLPDAFFVRKAEKDTGLSVSYHCTYAECRAQFNTTYGVASLLVSSVNQLGLHVVPDAPKHANIKVIPYKEEDPKMAEWYATQLAKAAKVVDIGKQVTKQQ
jgi:hypothetical protein